MMRRGLAVCLIICLLLVTLAVPSYGAVGEPGAGLMALYYRSASATLGISSNGVAEGRGDIKEIIGTTTKTTVHLYLQQYENGDWVDVDDWLDSDETVNRTLTKQITVEKGFKYRAKASCYAYSGTKCEHVTKYSAEVSY